jgi:glutathione S-transferase
MMTLTLLMHPLASFCHKVLIALYENGTPFEARTVDFADPGSSAELFERWPVGKIPLLVDEAAGRVVPETSVIIEYLDRRYPGPAPLLPEAEEARLEARLWDRFFDLYVHVPMQKIVADRIRPEGRGDPFGVEEARTGLRTAYEVAETRFAGRTWAAGDSFGLADCAAAPALFYGSIVEPFDPGQQALAAYFERLLARPSVARTIREARPYFPMFPFREAMPQRFLEG